MDNRSRFEQAVARLEQPHACDDETATHIEIVKKIQQRFSLLHKVQITTPGRKFHAYVKQYYLKEPGEAHRELMTARVEKDYQVTCLLYERFLNFPQLSVPRPLACFPELLTVVFEESRGENFLELIQRYARGWPSRQTLRPLIGYAELCGEWLRKLQHMFPKEGSYSIPQMWEEIDDRLQQLVTNPRARFHESLRQQMCQYFEKLEAGVGTAELRRSAIHADFSPGNMLADPSGVTAIDFAMFKEGSIYQDLTRFYHQLDLLLLKPSFRPHVVRQLQQAFLQGYDALFDRKTPMFEAFYLRHTTTHFITMTKIQDPPLHERWYNKRVCRQHRYAMEKVTAR